MAFGLIPHASPFTQNHNFVLNTDYTIDQTQNFGYGDPVSINANGVLVPTTAGNAAAGVTLPAGIFQGCIYTSTNQSFPSPSPARSWVANTPALGAVYAQIVMDPFIEFLIQANAAVAITAIGDNFNLTAAAAPSSDGTSTRGLDVANIIAGQLGQVKVMNVYQTADNTWGTPTTILRCQWNFHLLRAGSFGGQ